MIVVENVLPPVLFEKALSYFKSAEYTKLRMSETAEMYYSKLPKPIDSAYHLAVQKALGKPLNTLYAFARLNTESLDTSFRIHADGKILDKQPKWAAVLYLEDSTTSGTAFYEHPIHGRSAVGSPEIFEEDDGLWTAHTKYYAKANSMIVYDALEYHGRFPWQVSGERVVLVRFMN
jgi:hypothetical protein